METPHTEEVATMSTFVVQLTNDRTHTIDTADAYQPEGPLTTFFSTGSNRTVLDSWSTRVASFRTSDVIAIQRDSDFAILDNEDRLILAG